MPNVPHYKAGLSFNQLENKKVQIMIKMLIFLHDSMISSYVSLQHLKLELYEHFEQNYYHFNQTDFNGSMSGLHHWGLG